LFVAAGFYLFIIIINKFINIIIIIVIIFFINILRLLKGPGKNAAYERTLAGLVSILLAHKVKPEIRYQVTLVLIQLFI
jgi:hypothetical protein